MIIHRSKLTWSLVNSQAYAQAYINRPIQTLSMTLWPSLLRRTARKKDLPHLPGPPAACSSDSRTRTGIVYPLRPCSRQPDVCIQVEASLPEPAALLRPDLRQPSREAPTSLPRTRKRFSHKRRRQHSTALYRPAKRSPPRGHWCDVKYTKIKVTKL